MEEKTRESTNTESIENPPSKNSFLYTIKSAASLMVLGPAPQSKNIGWKEDIRAKQQMLYAELQTVKNGWRSQITLAGFIELVEYALRNIKGNYSDLYREEFKSAVTSIFTE